MPTRHPTTLERLDQLGAVSSSLCAAHCALCALLPAALGALGLGVLLGHQVEWLFTLLAVVLSSSALVLSWRRHRSVPVALLFTLGIAGLLAARSLEMGSGPHHPMSGPAMGMLAGVLLVSGHLLNLRVRRCCPTEGA